MGKASATGFLSCVAALALGAQPVHVSSADALHQALRSAAPGTVILTDGPGGRVELDRMTLPYKGVVLSEGYFLLLVRMAGEKVGP